MAPWRKLRGFFVYERSEALQRAARNEQLTPSAQSRSASGGVSSCAEREGFREALRA